jgi:amidohydrolase
MTTGPITSAADLVDIELTGPGGHTARPELTVDLVRTMGEVALKLPEVLRRRTGNGPVKLTFGHARAGDAPNVVPSSARLYGTMRTQDMSIWQDAPQLLAAALPEVLEPTGADWDLTYRRGVPPVVNDIAATEFARDIALAEFGIDQVVPAGQSWGGDTFAWYLEKSPGSYIRLGTHNPDWSGRRLDLHASTFDVDERAIGVGTRFLVATALTWLRQAT